VKISGPPPVFVAYRAGQAIDYLKNNPVDLVLLDINLEDDIDGIEIAD
jgi:DNA-binding response OmpR family regulator